MEFLEAICFIIVVGVFVYYAYFKLYEMILFVYYKSDRCCRKCGSMQKRIKMPFSGAEYWVSSLNLKKDCVCHRFLDRE